MSTQSVPPKQSVAIKEMKMNSLQFGEVIFGGDPEKNLKKENKFNQTINKTIIRETLKQQSRSP